MNEKYISIADLCGILQVSRSTVDRWRKEGLPCIKIGKGIRFIQEEAIKWIKENSNNLYKSEL
jgi:predicted DNA-binding transcriptional regulator AlpA